VKFIEYVGRWSMWLEVKGTPSSGDKIAWWARQGGPLGLDY